MGYFVAFVWPRMILAEVVTLHPVMHVVNSPRISGDLFSVLLKPAKVFSEINYNVAAKNTSVLLGREHNCNNC